MGEPEQMELCDALDSLLHKEVPAMGFKEEIFRLKEIDDGLTLGEAE